jgi:hypothetical protein
MTNGIATATRGARSRTQSALPAIAVATGLALAYAAALLTLIL